MSHVRARITLGLLLLAATTAMAMAEAYPTRPIRLIVPYAAGGTTDTLSRLLAQKLGERLGQVVIVENRPGADTIIGTEALAKAIPDGYTIGFTSSNAIAILPHTRKALSYDPFGDFSHIAQIAESQFVLAVHPSVPARSVSELVAFARSRPDQLTYASASEAGHITAEMFKVATGTAILHVPYKGGAPATTDLLSGQVTMMFTAFGNAVPLFESGRLRALAVTGARRSAALPNVPTLAETGLKGFVSSGVYGISAPRGVSPDVVKRLNTEIQAILRMPEIIEKYLAQGVEPRSGTPEQYIEELVSSSTRHREVLQKIGFTRQ